MHVVVYDTTGDITGAVATAAGGRTAGVIEIFANMSKNPNAKTAQGSNNYYPDVIFAQSHLFTGQIIFLLVLTGEQILHLHTLQLVPITLMHLTGGTDDYAVTAGEMELAYDKFADTESLDINLVLGGLQV